MSPYEFILQMKDYASGGIRKIADSVGLARREVKAMNSDMDKAGASAKGLGSGLSLLGGVLSGIIASISIGFIVSQIISARVEYEKFQATLTSTFQSAEVAKSALNMLGDFAKETPYKLTEVTESFIQLTGRGINPTKAELVKLGDLAQSQGKSLSQMTTAFLAANNGQLGSLRQFGISAKKEGNTVQMSFRGITKTVKNNSAAIRDAVLEYGEMKGVAGSMAGVSKTLGVRLKNLGDQLNDIFVQMGQYSGGIFDTVFDGMGKGLNLVLKSLPYVAHFFDAIWKSIKPVLVSIWNFIKAGAGIFTVSNTFSAFKSIVSGVLLVVDLFSTGVTWLFEALEPLSPLIVGLTAVWAAWNLMVAISPIGWIVIGIVALISVIGMVIKYTDGWSKSWQAFKTMFVAAWRQIKSDFNLGVESIKLGFNLMVLAAADAGQKIVGKFVNVGKSIAMALKGDFDGAFDKLNERVNTSAEREATALVKNYQKLVAEHKADRIQNAEDLIGAKKDFGITIDTKGIVKDFKNLKDKFSAITGDNKSTAAYDSFANKNKSPANNIAGKDKEAKISGITSGGARQTHITINIQKLQDDTKIYVDSTEKGIANLGEKVQEMMLRAVNSANQMQTG